MTPDEMHTPLVGQGELVEVGQGDLFTVRADIEIQVADEETALAYVAGIVSDILYPPVRVRRARVIGRRAVGKPEVTP